MKKVNIFVVMLAFSFVAINCSNVDPKVRANSALERVGVAMNSSYGAAGGSGSALSSSVQSFQISQATSITCSANVGSSSISVSCDNGVSASIVVTSSLWAMTLVFDNFKVDLEGDDYTFNGSLAINFNLPTNLTNIFGYSTEINGTVSLDGPDPITLSYNAMRISGLGSCSGSVSVNTDTYSVNDKCLIDIDG